MAHLWLSRRLAAVTLNSSPSVGIVARSSASKWRSISSSSSSSSSCMPSAAPIPMAASRSVPNPDDVSKIRCQSLLMKRMSTNITNHQAASHAHTPAPAPAVPHHKGDLLYDRATNPLFVAFEGLDGAKKEYPLYTIPTGTKKRNVKNQPVRTRIKPGMIRKRLEKMRTFEGSEKAIRHSPWRMNLVCQLAAQQPTVVDSLLQMEFCIKKRAPPIVETVIRRTCNLADIQHGLQPCQLEVAECFATQGTHLKRIKFMGRGRTGTKHRKFTHMRLVLREIDFPLKIALSRTVSQKKKWILRQQIAEQEAAVARQERQEMKQLEALAKERNDLKEASSKNKS